MQQSVTLALPLALGDIVTAAWDSAPVPDSGRDPSACNCFMASLLLKNSSHHRESSYERPKPLCDPRERLT